MRISSPWLGGMALVVILTGCATPAPTPASTTVVNRFYRDIEICLRRTWPDAERKSTFSQYSPTLRVQPVYETVTYTISKKTDREFRIVLNESPPDTTAISTFAVGRSVTAAEIAAHTQPVVDRCSEMPF